MGDDVPAAAHGRQQAIVGDGHRSCSFRPVGREVDERGYARCFSPWTDRGYPRLQLRTIADLLDGRGIDYPVIGDGNVTFRKARRAAEGQGNLPT